MRLISIAKDSLGLSSPPQLPAAGRLPLAILLLTAIGLVVPLLGEYSSFFAHLCLLTAPLTLATGAAAAVLVVIALLRRAYATAARMLVVVLLTRFVLVLDAQVILGTPQWVKRQARPAIEAVVRLAGEGPYPKPDRASTNALPTEVARIVASTGCFYSDNGDASTFHITCQGVLFTKCSYDHRTKQWRAWD